MLKKKRVTNKTHCVVNFPCYTGFLRWSGISGKLFSRTHSCWIQLLAVSTIHDSCVCCFTGQMDPQPVRTSMGLYFNMTIWMLTNLPYCLDVNKSKLKTHLCIYFQNSTMEHYTNYKVSELKTTVLALADLQLNTKGCPLNAIREKYKQQKVDIQSQKMNLSRALYLFVLLSFNPLLVIKKPWVLGQWRS